MNHLKIAILVLIMLLLFVSHSEAQKPKVQVRLKVELNTFFGIKYQDKIEDIEFWGTRILADTLDQYIGFADFTPDSADLILDVELNNKFKNPGASVQEFYLFFTFTDNRLNKHLHAWEFLEVNEFVSLGPETSDVLNKLSEDWSKYLEGHYNNDLVAKMFQNVAFSLPDSTHYYIENGWVKAILPLPKEAIMLDTLDCKFRVIIRGTDNTGSTAMDAPKEMFYSSTIKANKPGIPSRLWGCILVGSIKAEDIPLSRLVSGSIYITNYRRGIYPGGEADANNFVNENIQ